MSEQEAQAELEYLIARHRVGPDMPNVRSDADVDLARKIFEWKRARAISAGMLSDKELAQRLRVWAVSVEHQKLYPTDKKIIAALLNESAARIARREGGVR